MRNTYRDRYGKLRFRDSHFPVHKWIVWKEGHRNNYFDTNALYGVKKYILAFMIQLILIIWQVPSKEDVQISLIQTILPLSSATQPLTPFVTIIAIILQIYPLYVLYELIHKIIM